jgi:diphthamide synthase subunit DPH2
MDRVITVMEKHSSQNVDLEAPEGLPKIARQF